MTLLTQWAEVLNRGVELVWEIHQFAQHGDAEKHLSRVLPMSLHDVGRFRRLAHQMFGPAPREVLAFRRETVEHARRLGVDINRLVVINVAAGKIPQQYRMVREQLFRRMVDQAMNHSIKELKNWGNRLVSEMHPDPQSGAHHKRAVRNSRTSDADGLMHMMIRGPELKVARLITHIESAARRRWRPSDEVRFEQAKFDALEELILGRFPYATAPNNPLTSLIHQPAVVIRAPELNQDRVVLDEHGREWFATTDGAMLTAEDYISLRLADHGWAVVIGQNNQPLSLRQIERRFSPAQKAAQALMQLTCAGSDCHRPAIGCEGHHIHPWSQGGKTTMSNLALLCSSCHARVGEHSGSRNDRLNKTPDGRFEWISPDGTRHRSAMPVDSCNGIALAVGEDEGQPSRGK
ncbi:DUF222 domain-containing protein [Corynebacterium sp. 3HC-13]|uniref:HNH endonuclease signature motif containing protein n=1 Tax=Corynebacterium poyangense TaxID=2684405 RepID=UPI001CCDCC2C|nr:HNH endonuclease signature motif containing protein [Corynebacterium poyangense]MBZ8178231.1 DUF222 domain-containing protein [Corynebacterium poyangense]